MLAPAVLGVGVMVGCSSRCPECHRKCTAVHRDESGLGRGVHEVGMVWLDETMHAHMSQHSHRCGFPVHAWRVLPRRHGEVTMRPRIKKHTLDVRVIAGHGAQPDQDGGG